MLADPKRRVSVYFLGGQPHLHLAWLATSQYKSLSLQKEAALLRCIWFARHYMVHHQTDFHTENLTLYNPYSQSAGSGATG